MYKNVGGKIKKIAEIITGIGVLISLLEGLIIMILPGPEGVMFFLGLIVGGMGCFFSWLGQILLYGYGQLIENSDKLVRMQMSTTGINQKELGKEQEKGNTSIHVSAEPSRIGKCDICDKENVPVSMCTIKDELGTRYRNMCEECAQKDNLNI